MRNLFLILSACLLAAPASAQSSQDAAAPTWNTDVAPIVYAKCAECHRDGEIAPMSLMSYAAARPWAKGMKASVMAQDMPPWFADPRYGKFNNARSLTQEQIDTLVAWADAGAPLGTGPEPVAPEYGARSSELMDRPPDAVIQGVEVEIGANEVIPFFPIWLKSPFEEDKYIEAVENRPGNRAVTHHSTLHADPLPQEAHHIGMGPLWADGFVANAVPVLEDGTPVCSVQRNTDCATGADIENDFTTNAPQFALQVAGSGRGDNLRPLETGSILTSYAPGAGALRYQPGLVAVLPHDGAFRWSMHYNATGRPETDLHTVNLWFTKPGESVLTLKRTIANDNNFDKGEEIIGSGALRPNVPANAANYRVASLMVITSDSTLNDLWPHMHLRGKDMMYSVTYPDGREEILISVPNYTFEWQTQYQFEEPVKLPAGSVIRVHAHFDNSPSNRFNPAPNQEVPWGQQSWHEMYFPAFDIAIDKDVIEVGAQQN